MSLVPAVAVGHGYSRQCAAAISLCVCYKAADFRGREFCRQEGLFEIHRGCFSCGEHDKNEPWLQFLMRRWKAIHHSGGEWGRRAGSLPANSQGSLPSGQLEELDQALLEGPVLNSWEIFLLSRKFQMQLFPSSHCEFFRELKFFY